MKFSIVTPVFNSETHLTETIKSIITQKGKFDIELIFVDNLSTDRSMAIIKKYESEIKNKKFPVQCRAIDVKIISERDEGMYDALNKGFNQATGDIYAWANSDDIYFPGAFEIVSKIFEKYKKIQWLKGITSFIDENSEITRLGRPYLFYQKWIRHGVYGRKLYFITQSSTFWRPELWTKVNGLDGKLKLAGDFELWTKFAKHTPLYCLNYNTDCFRYRPGQLSKSLDKYHAECETVLPLPSDIVNRLNFYKKVREKLPFILRPFLYFAIFGLQKFHVIDVDINKELFYFKKRTFYFYDFWGTRY